MPPRYQPRACQMLGWSKTGSEDPPTATYAVVVLGAAPSDASKAVQQSEEVDIEQVGLKVGSGGGQDEEEVTDAVVMHALTTPTMPLAEASTTGKTMVFAAPLQNDHERRDRAARASHEQSSTMSCTSETTARSRQLVISRRNLSRRTEGALKRQKQAAEAKEKLHEREKYVNYELQKMRLIEEDSERVIPMLRVIPVAAIPVGMPVGDKVDAEEKRVHQVSVAVVQKAFESIKQADLEMADVQVQLKTASVLAREKAWKREQHTWKQKATERKIAAKAALQSYSVDVKEQAHERALREALEAKQRQARAVERLEKQAVQQKELEVAEAKERERQLELRKRMLAASLRKKEETERREREVQIEVAEERERDKAEAKEHEEAKERRRVEQMTEARQAKREAWAWKAKQDAEAKRAAEAEVNSRFKASETERAKREAQRLAEEKAEHKKMRLAQQRKAEDEARKRKMQREEQAKAAKEALKAAQAAQFEVVNGELRRMKDPAAEQMRKMRLLEEEQVRAMRERDVDLAAKEAAFERRKKDEAFQRELQVQAAQREVAATFKKNQEKELRDRLAREAADKERYRLLAKEMRAKIDEQNRKDLEAEREAAENLKRMKAAQYEADLATHLRNERMKGAKARHERHLQGVVWEERMAWEEKEMEEERQAKLEAMRYFSEQRASKEAESEELRQIAMNSEQEMKLMAEEKRAAKEEAERQRLEDELEAKEAMVQKKSVKAGDRGTLGAETLFWDA